MSMPDLQSALLMLVSAFAAGLIQSVTGFGAGIVMMVFLPGFMSITRGAAVSTLVAFPLNAAMVWTYRKHIRIGNVLKPLPFYLIFSTTAIYLAAGNDFTMLGLVFGIFLVLLSVYFFFFSKKIHLKAGLLSAGICGTVSGMASGLFGIGGPPMVIYYLALTNGEKFAYLASVQAFFFVTGITNIVTRITSGIITVDMTPYVVIGVTGILSGKLLGTRIVDRLNAEVMKKIIYAFLALSGILNIVSAL